MQIPAVNFHILCTLLELLAIIYTSSANSEEEVSKLLHDLDPELTQEKNNLDEALWKYKVEKTNETACGLREARDKYRTYMKSVVDKLMIYNQTEFKDPILKRQISIINKQGSDILTTSERDELNKILMNMRMQKKQKRVCNFRNTAKCTDDLYENVTEIMARSRDPEELKFYWLQWHDRDGAANIKLFRRYLEISKKTAEMNNFQTKAEMIISDYNSTSFEDDIDDMYLKFIPLYEQLHAYMRHHLAMKYRDVFDVEGPIPIHLVGNMYGHNWENIKDVIPEKRWISLIITIAKRAYDIYKLVRETNRYMESMDLEGCPKIRWVKTFLMAGEKIACDPSGFVFTPEDVRVHICTTLIIANKAFKLIGDLVTKIKQKTQPYALRNSEIPELDQTLGNVLELSGQSPKYLQDRYKKRHRRDGESPEYTEEQHIKSLLHKSLGIFPAMAFQYTMIRYRFDIYRGLIKNDLNCDYWWYRLRYSGLEAPVPRDESCLDPAAKIDFATDKEDYLKGFLETALQYQVYKKACIMANEYVPGDPAKMLSKCNLYGNKEVGAMFNKVFSMGASKKWQEVVQDATGSDKINVDGLLEYFQPLHIWLQNENRILNNTIGWSKNLRCERSIGINHRNLYNCNSIIKSLLIIMFTFCVKMY